MDAPTTEADATSSPDASPTRPGRRWLLVIGAVAAVAAGVTWWWLTDGDLPADVVVAVHGTEVTESDVERQIEVLQALYGLEPPAGDSDDAEAFRGDLAAAIALNLVVEQAAAARDLGIPERTVQDELARLIEGRYPVAGRTGFIDALSAQGISETDVTDEIRRQLLYRRTFDDVVTDVEVTEDDVREAFDANRDGLAVPERRRLRHLVVDGADAAEAALARVTDGAPFAEVAAEVSLDESTREQGGDLGEVAREQLDDSFAAAAFDVAEGEVFGPVESALGWHVGLVEQVLPPQEATLDNSGDLLAARLRSERQLEVWAGWLREEVEARSVRFRDDFEPDGPLVPSDEADVPDLAPGSDPARPDGPAPGGVEPDVKEEEAS